MKKIVCLFFILFSGIISAQEKAVTLTFESKKISDTEYDIVFKTTIEDGWHQYSLYRNPDCDDPKKDLTCPNPTEILFNKSADYELVGKPTESKPIEEYDKVFETKVSYFKNNATFKQRIKLKTNKTTKVSGTFFCQFCTDEMCNQFQPPKKFSLEIKGVEFAAVDTITKTVTTPSIDTTKKQEVAKAPETKTEEPKKEAATPWWLIFLKGIGFGLAALITPCVFPMIPMNVSFFLKRNKTRSGAIKEAMVFVFSIIIIYTSLGLLITALFGETALNTLASGAAFNIFFFLMLLVFGVSFLGAFEIVLPNSWLNKIDSQSDRSGFIGIFFMAAALSIVSFSCTGIFIGSLLPLVANSPTGPLFGFLGFGAGFAIPFGLFAIVPSLLQSMPKSGGWLNTVKVTLGLLELALALKFASNADLVYQAHILNREVFLTLWIVLFGLTGIYLMGWFKLSHDTEAPFLSIPRLFIAILAFGFTVYMIPGLWGAPLKLLSGVIPPSSYSEWKHAPAQASVIQSSNQNNASALAAKMVDGPEGLKVFDNDYESALAYAKEVHKPLMIDFTGHACANCRKMEDNVWVEGDIKNILANDLVIVSLFVDDRKELPKAEQKEVMWSGDKVTLETEGMKWGFMQLSKYNISSQPYYVILNDDEMLLSNGGIGYDTGKDLPVFNAWLSNAILKYKEKHAN